MANITGRGLPLRKKGERRGGRQPGSMNAFGRDLKEALLDAAEEVEGWQLDRQVHRLPPIVIYNNINLK
jgi:hypothetical protein